MQIKKKKAKLHPTANIGSTGEVGMLTAKDVRSFSGNSISAKAPPLAKGLSAKRDPMPSISANTSPMNVGMITAKLRGAKKGVSAAQREGMAKEPKGKVTDPAGFAIDKGDGFERTTSKREAYLARLKKRK